jgi:hypothetical protein
MGWTTARRFGAIRSDLLATAATREEEKACKQALPKAAEGTRTLDLLHGNSSREKGDTAESP